MIDIMRYATWVPLAAGILIPLAVAWLTKLNATPFIKGLVAFVIIGLVSLGTYLANFDGVTHTWNGALYAFVLAIFSAASTRYAVTGGWADTKVAAATANFGVGSNSTSQKAA